jgi:hypothetical protein
MEEFSLDEEGSASSRVVRSGDVDTIMKGTASVPHCWEPSVTIDAVETGKGNRLEQLRPEQGLERYGSGRSKGEREKPSGLAELPATTSSSSWLISCNGSSRDWMR